MAKIDRFLEKCYNLFRYRGERVSDMLKTGNLKNERVIGYNIYRIMEQQNVTVEQLASLVQTSEIHIKEITTGSIDVQDDELVLIAEGLGVDEQDLLQTVPDEELQEYNIHFMGTATCTSDMNKILDKTDMYVRMLNAQSPDR